MQWRLEIRYSPLDLGSGSLLALRSLPRPGSGETYGYSFSSSGINYFQRFHWHLSIRQISSVCIESKSIKFYKNNVSQVKKRGIRETIEKTTDKGDDGSNVYENSAKFYASALLPSSLCLTCDFKNNSHSVPPPKKKQ